MSISDKAISARGTDEVRRRYAVNKEVDEAMRREVVEVCQLIQRDFKGFASSILGERPRNSGKGFVRFYANNHLDIALRGPRAGSWYDFTEGKGGGPIQFVMFFRSLSFAEAMAFCRSYFGLPVPKWAQGKKAPKELRHVSDEELTALVQSGERKHLQRLKEIYGEDHPTVTGFAFSEFKNGKVVARKPLPDVLMATERPATSVHANDDDDGGDDNGGGGGAPHRDGDDDPKQDDGDTCYRDSPTDDDDVANLSMGDFISGLSALIVPSHLLGITAVNNTDVAALIEETTERENERKRRGARTLWSGTVAVAEGSGVWNYLTSRCIQPEVMELPDSVRMTRNGLTLVTGFTNVSGEIVAVQRTPVTQDGRKNPFKRHDEDGEVVLTPKKANGRLSEGFCVLRGWGSAQVSVIAEGAETGLSIWKATGYDVYVMGGAIGPRKAALLKEKVGGGIVLMARDDDATKNPASGQFIRAYRKLFASGVTVREIYPTGTRRGDGSDFNDLHQREGTAAVASRVAMGLATPASNRLTEAAHAKVALRQQVMSIYAMSEEHRTEVDAADTKLNDWAHRSKAEIKTGATVTDVSGLMIGAELTPSLQIGIPFGVGTNKTGLSIEAADAMLSLARSQGDNRAIAFFAPEHKLGAEVIKRIGKMFPNRRVSRWISKPVAVSERGAEKTVYACTDYESFSWMTPVGLGYSGLCPGCDGSCEHAQAYEAVKPEVVEERGPVDIWVMAHAAAFSPELPTPVAENGLMMAFFDETVWPSAVKAPYKLTASDIQASPLVPKLSKSQIKKGISLHSIQLRHDDARVGLRKLMELDVGTFITADHLRDAGFDYSLARQALGWEHDRFIGLTEETSDAPPDFFEPNKTAQPMADAFAMFAKALDPYCDPHDLWACPVEVIEEGLTDKDGKVIEGTPKVKKLKVMARRALNPTLAKMPSVLLNGTLIDELERSVFPHLQLGEHVFSDVPHLKVFTVVDHSYYNGWLAGVSRKTDTKDDRAELAADRAKAIVTVGAVMSVRTGEKALFMSNVETRKLIEPQIASFGSALNYGALAGRDEFHRHVEMLIGRNQPDHSAVEDMLMALVGRAIARQLYVKTDAAVTLRSPDGSLHQITVQSDQHLSPLCEMIRWHLCEGQHEQGLARNRAIWEGTAEQPLFALMLNNTPSFRPVDGLIPFYEVSNPPLWARMFAAKGFVLTARRDIRAVFGDDVPFDNAESPLDRPQWPLHIVQGAHGTTVGAPVHGLPTLFDRLIRVEYVLPQERYATKVAYVSPYKIDEMRRVLNEKLCAELVEGSPAGSLAGTNRGSSGLPVYNKYKDRQTRSPENVPAKELAGVFGQTLTEMGIAFPPGVDGALAVLRHMAAQLPAGLDIKPDAIKKALQRLSEADQQAITSYVGHGTHLVSVPAGDGRKRASSPAPFLLSPEAVAAMREMKLSVDPIPADTSTETDPETNPEPDMEAPMLNDQTTSAREPVSMMATVMSHEDAGRILRYDEAWNLSEPGADAVETFEHPDHDDDAWAEVQRIARAFLELPPVAAKA